MSNIRYAIRSLLKKPMFMIIAVVTLALGIGANTAIFSLIQTVLLQPLPIDEPERLVSPPGAVFSYPAYLDFQSQNRVFEDVIAFDTLGRRLRLNQNGSTELIAGESVSANYFGTARADIILGRSFESEAPDAMAGVISYDLWQRSFEGDPAIIGRQVTVNNQSINIIGVVAQGFRGFRLNRPVDLWFPITMHSAMATGGQASIQLDGRGAQWVRMMGRLKPDVTIEQALMDLNIIGQALNTAFPATDQWQFDELVSVLSQVAGGRTGELNRFIWILYGAVAISLLIACANVANLLLVRSETRRREIGIRLAIGAKRNQLVRQLLTESILLSIMGGVVGLLVALWVIDLLYVFELPGRVQIGSLGLGLDLRVLSFTFLLSLVIGVAFGIAPALHLSRPNVVDTLKDGGTNLTSGKSWLRHSFVVIQIAFSVVLLIGGSLLVQSLRNALSEDLGFNAEQVMMASVDLGLQGYDEARAKNYYTQTMERVRSLPGIESASWAFQVPVGRGNYMENITAAGYQPQPDEQMAFSMNFIWSGYFRTMQIPLMTGRDFTDRDNVDAPGVVIINNMMAERFWPGQNPVGKRIQLAGYTTWHEVVGVVNSSKYFGFNETPIPYMYLPFAQSMASLGLNEVKLIARTTGNPESMIATVRQIMQGQDAELPVYGAITWQQHFDYLLQSQRMGMNLLGAFSLLALILTIVGIYGVIAYAVSRRTHEIGIRLALGARSKDVMTMVFKQGMLMTTIGLVIGCVAALLTTQILSSLLYDIEATDAVTYMGVMGIFAVIAGLAVYIPARRATRVDPLIALRSE